MFLRTGTENAVFTVCQDNPRVLLLIAVLAMLCMQWFWFIFQTCNINNQYLGFNAVFCTCQVPLSRLYNPQLQGQLTKAVLKKACQSRGLIWLAVVFAELLGFCWQSGLFFPPLSLGFASSSLSCLWLWCAEVMYNKFFTLSLLRQPWLQLNTDRERRDRGKIHRDRKKEEQRPGFLKEIGKFNH